MEQLPAVPAPIKVLGVLLLLGLPLMTALSVWQTVVTRRAGDDALARSWVDATKSFAGMMVASWLLVWGGWVAWQHLLRLLLELKRG